MDQLDKIKPHVLGIFRIIVGFLFACHGIATLFDVLGGPQSGRVPSFPEWPSWWAAAIQLAGGILVMVGFGTRPAAMICSGSMAFAYFTKHQPHELLPIQNNGEPAAMFCWAFLLIVAFGPGSWAISSVLARGRSGAGTAGTRVPAPAARG